VDDQYGIFLIGGDDDETALFTLFDDGRHCRLQCDYRDKIVESTSTDFFQALCDIRGLVARDGLIPFCYGASLNVFPSGMARDMGQGLKAYKLTEGRHARMADLVEIFAEGPDVIPASVEAQEKFYRDWLASPRS
jgi:hypothetical protein